MRNKIKMAMDTPVARVANIVVVQCPYLSTKPIQQQITCDFY